MAVVLLAVAVFGLPATASAQSQADVDRAEADLARAKAQESATYKKWEQARAELNVAVEEFTELSRKRENLTETIDKLKSQIAVYEEDAVAADQRAKDIVIDAYTGGGSAGVESAFTLSALSLLE